MITISHLFSPCYVAERTIQLSDVIEDWKLDCNLACVIKYIERASHENPTIEDLRKAEWYLDRAYLKENGYQRTRFVSHQIRASTMYSPQAVCDDWQLSNLLCSTLINIFLSQECLSHILRTKALNGALEHLREEIVFFELKLDLESDFKLKFQN